MKKLIVVCILLCSLIAVAQEPLPQTSQPEKSKEMEILELKIQLVRERKEKLQAQFILATQEEEKLMSEYKALIAKENKKDLK